MKKGAPNPNCLLREAKLAQPPPSAAQLPAVWVGRSRAFFVQKSYQIQIMYENIQKSFQNCQKLSQDYHKVIGLFKWFEFFCIKKIHEINVSIIIDKNIVRKLKLSRTIVFKKRQNGPRSLEL